MEWIEWTDPNAFEARVLSTLQQQEAENSLMIGVLGHVKAGIYETYHQVTIENEGELLAILQVTPPHPLNLVLFSERTDVFPFLIEEAITRDMPFTEVVSKKAVIERFRDEWTAATGRAADIFMAQGLYRLDTVSPLEMTDGQMRRAGEADRLQLEAWYAAFERESGLRSSSPEKIANAIGLMLDNEDAFLWEVDGTSVSCARRSRPAGNGITVSFVYTEPAHRGNGYARSLVADLSRYLLETKAYCTLYTDLSNPTSNKIYREIGYRQIMESAWVRLAR